MYCKYCGTKLADDARFCGNCGQNLVENVSEAAPAQPVYTQPVYTQPAYAESATVEKKSAFSGETLLPLIAAMVFGFFGFVNILRGFGGGTTILGVFGNMIVVGAAVLIVLTLFNVLKNDNLFCAVAMFALAFAEMIVMDGLLWYISLLLIPAFVVAGLYYLLKGKLFNSTIKMIMAIAVWALGFFQAVRFISWHLPFFTILLVLVIAAAQGLFIFSYTPYKEK